MRTFAQATFLLALVGMFCAHTQLFAEVATAIMLSALCSVGVCKAMTYDAEEMG